MLEGDRPDRLAVQDLVVGGAQGRRVPDRELLLAAAELRVVLLDPHALLAQRLHDLVDHHRRRLHPDRAEAERLVERDVTVLDPHRQRPLRARRLPSPAALRRWRGGSSASGSCAGRRPRARRRGVCMSASIGPDAGRIRQHDERVRIRDQADLADRPHPLDGLKLVQQVHRLHRDGQADPAIIRLSSPSVWDAFPRITPRCRSTGSDELDIGRRSLLRTSAMATTASKPGAGPRCAHCTGRGRLRTLAGSRRRILSSEFQVQQFHRLHSCGAEGRPERGTWSMKPAQEERTG